MSLGRLLVSRIFLIVKIDDFWIEFIECRHVLLGERQPALLRFAAMGLCRSREPAEVLGHGFPGCAPGKSEFNRSPTVAVPRVASIATLAHSKSCSYWQLRTSVIGLRTGKRWARKKSKNSTETLGFSARERPMRRHCPPV